MVKNSHSHQSQKFGPALQARQAKLTLDVEVANILNLIEDLKQLRGDDILAESKLVAEGCCLWY